MLPRPLGSDAASPVRRSPCRAFRALPKRIRAEPNILCHDHLHRFNAGHFGLTLPVVQADALARPGLSHAFFTRLGGVSEGLYASLNGGVGSRDVPHAVAENRCRMAAALGVAPDHLVVPYQVHSAEVRIVAGPLTDGERPRVDGLVTRVPGLAVGVTGADCGVVLLAEPDAGVIGAVHAGWKGAFGGVLEATVSAMVSIGAKPAAMTAVLGPTIAQNSYEVGDEFRQRFVTQDAAFARFFVPSTRPGHARFDLPAFILMRLQAAGVGHAQNLGLDTYADEARFYSYRRSTHRGEPDYGRLVAAIALGR